MVSVDSLARAVGHPLRVRIVAALDDGPRGLDALAACVEADPRTVARHARVLEQAGLVGRARSGRRTTYRLTDTVSFSDDEYGSISQASREAAVAAALAHSHTAAASALESGGFERPDVHLSRTSLELTEAQWRELSDELAELLERIETTNARDAAEHDGRVEATAVLMLFERSGTHRQQAPHTEEPFSPAEGLERSWELSEQLELALSGPAADWPAVVALTDQLRVLARAALSCEMREHAADAPHAIQPGVDAPLR